MTSAPSAANCWVAKGPASTWVKSIDLQPLEGEGHALGVNSKNHRAPEVTVATGIGWPPAYLRDSSANKGSSIGPSWMRTRLWL